MRILEALALLLLATACAPRPEPPLANWQSVEQGPHWTPEDRAQFYTQDQGSELMPAAWMMALRQPGNGLPFMADRLARYGYLANTSDVTASLPVGFTVAGPPGQQVLGMTCAACHTREIEVGGRPYRIDGGPALADFEQFLRDIHAAMGAVRDDPAIYATFATSVLGTGASAPEQAALRAEVELWYRRYDAIVTGSLPRPAMWGAGRLDAVSMIFNRVTGLDIGPPPDYLIRDNIRPADAPVRYPFLWNASRQDRIQWPGFASNGNDLLALARNLGEVLGVFGTFHPQRDPRIPLFRMNYVARNSANFAGLGRLEHLIKRIGPPRYPFLAPAGTAERTASDALAQQGETIFRRDPAQGGCAECHEARTGELRSLTQRTWATPLRDVNTDMREFNLLSRTARSGVMTGAGIAGVNRLKPTDTAFNILGMAVIGSIAQRPFEAELRDLVDGPLDADPGASPVAASLAAANAVVRQLRESVAAPPPTGGAYEARVLEGIWAAAPYLHNGSVPTLADLLEPAAQRPASFLVGAAYDPVRVGLAAEQPNARGTIVTTDCTDRNSGNSRCGHEYGATSLTRAEKQALLEYLRRL